jgi:hypothetical protein
VLIINIHFVFMKVASEEGEEVIEVMMTLEVSD